MKAWLRWLVVLVSALGVAERGWGQKDTLQKDTFGTDHASVRFHFERAGVEVPSYTFLVLESGKGTYTAEGVPVRTSVNKYSVKPAAGAEKTVQMLDLTQAMAGKMFELVRASEGLRGCESKTKNIADTGAKTITFYPAEKVEVSCTFNYSEKKPVAELTSMFEGMAYTLDEARKMEGEQKFDRLGLDQEMTLLVEAVKSGRAMGLANIRGTLQGIVDDDSVLERVRTQAAKLLELGEGEK